MRIINRLKQPNVYTLSDGSSFRLLAREDTNISDKKVTDKMRKDAKDGLLVLIPEKKKVKKKNEKKGKESKE